MRHAAKTQGVIRRGEEAEGTQFPQISPIRTSRKIPMTITTIIINKPNTNAKIIYTKIILMVLTS